MNDDEENDGKKQDIQENHIALGKEHLLSYSLVFVWPDNYGVAFDKIPVRVVHASIYCNGFARRYNEFNAPALIFCLICIKNIAVFYEMNSVIVGNIRRQKAGPVIQE